MKVSSQVMKALKYLQESGFEAWLVGGCVRDFLLGKEPKDIDITTSAEPDEMKKVFANFKTIDTGIKHGTITVCIENMNLEVTTFRIDGEYKDNRRPDTVKYTENLYEDLSRRDFTINAIAYTPQDGIRDYFGGVNDLRNGVIRGVGDAEIRFAEDALRILRGIRFAAVLGFDIEKETARAMFTQKHLVVKISGERVFNELEKMLCGKAVKTVLCEYIDVLEPILPEITAMKGFQQYNPYHDFDLFEHTLRTVDNVPPVFHLRLAALLHDVGKPVSFFLDEQGVGRFHGHDIMGVDIARDILNRLKSDSKTKHKVLELIKYHDYNLVADKKSVKRMLNKLDEESLLDLLLLKRADIIAQKGNKEDERLANLEKVQNLIRLIKQEGEAFKLKDLAVCGHDIIKLGVKPGKDVGIVLADLLEVVLEESLSNERQVLLDYVKKKYLN